MDEFYGHVHDLRLSLTTDELEKRRGILEKISRQTNVGQCRSYENETAIRTEIAPFTGMSKAGSQCQLQGSTQKVKLLIGKMALKFGATYGDNHATISIEKGPGRPVCFQLIQ